jgi:hypothetical protein
LEPFGAFSRLGRDPRFLGEFLVGEGEGNTRRHEEGDFGVVSTVARRFSVEEAEAASDFAR